MAIDHCKLAMQSQDHLQCISRGVQGEMLLKIDDNIDNVLGLVVFYQYITTTVVKQQQRFTTEAFAYYLHIRSLSVTKCYHFTKTSSTDEMKRYIRYICDMQQPLTADLLLFKTVNISCKRTYQYKARLTSDQHQKPTTNTSELVELLQLSAVEHLTIFRQVTEREFRSVLTIVTTDFEALYAHKRGDYQQCLQLSIQNVRKLLGGGRIDPFLTFPELVYLLDDDIVSLIAMMKLINPKCHLMTTYTHIDQMTRSLYLMAQSQMKLRHSVTQLDQTLDYVVFVRNRCSAELKLCQLTLKFIERQVLNYLSTSIDHLFNVSIKN